jgi:hypothetical protein
VVAPAVLLAYVLQEVDELCEEWEPEPLAPPLTDAQRAWREPIVSSEAGREVTVNGRKALNFASFNFLGIAGSPEVKPAAAYYLPSCYCLCASLPLCVSCSGAVSAAKLRSLLVVRSGCLCCPGQHYPGATRLSCAVPYPDVPA